MLNKLSNEKGFTLIEVISALVIGAILMVLTTSIIVTSIKNYNEIEQQNKLRDEADLLMSQLYKKMYTTKESEITKVESTYIEITGQAGCTTAAPCYVGYKGNQMYVGSRNPYTLSSDEIKLQSGNLKRANGVALGVFEINFTLASESKGHLEKDFENRVRTILDK